MIIIQLICSITVFVCCLFIILYNKQLRNYINKLKEDIADEKIERQTFIKQHNKKIATLNFMYSKTFNYVAGDFISNSADTKQCMKENAARSIAQHLIENNLIQIEEFDTYYQCNISFVQA